MNTPTGQNPRSHRPVFAGAIAAALGLIPLSSAQTVAPSASADRDLVALERFEVIGTRPQSTDDTSLNGVLVQSQANEFNANGTRFHRQLDSGRRSRGVEAEFTVSPLPAWDTTFTYAYIDARDRGATAALPDTPAEMTPRHAVSAYSRYALLTGPLQGLSARFGFIWQGERWSASRTPAAPDPLRLAGFHRFDAGLGYQVSGWRVALSLENLTNEYYLLAGSTGLAFSPSNPRSYAVRVSRTW